MPDLLLTPAMIENLAATGDAITINGRSFKFSSIDASATAQAPAPVATTLQPIANPSPAYLAYVAQQQAAKEAAAQAEADAKVAAEAEAAQEARTAEAVATARAMYGRRDTAPVAAVASAQAQAPADTRTAEAVATARGFNAARQPAGGQLRVASTILRRS